MRAGKLSPAETPIQIHNKNAIDFTEGWHLGLARVLKKLERDFVPRVEAEPEDALSDWAKRLLHVEEGTIQADEPVLSNWLRILALPKTLRISAFSKTPESISELQKQWPCRLVGWRVISFATLDEFDVPLAIRPLRPEDEIDTATFLTTGDLRLPALTFQDRQNIVTDLLRQAWELFAKQKGLSGYMLANEQLAWFVPKTEPKIEQVRYTDALGKSGRRALLGESKKLGAFWHLAMELVPAIGRVNRYTLRTHVAFTKDGQTPLGDASQMHRLRRSFCKQWWQNRWRDLTSAYVFRLAGGENTFKLPVGLSGCGVIVAAQPTIFVSPIQTVCADDGDAAAEEMRDDADLLYDESPGNGVDFEDEDDAEAGSATK